MDCVHAFVGLQCLSEGGDCGVDNVYVDACHLDLVRLGYVRVVAKDKLFTFCCELMSEKHTICDDGSKSMDVDQNVDNKRTKQGRKLLGLRYKSVEENVLLARSGAKRSA